MSETPPLLWSIEHPELLVGWVVAYGVEVAAADAELSAALAAGSADPARQGLDEATRAGIRDLLRGRGYKPSGRGKPASEFLHAAAARGAFPSINNVVDINNLLSLEYGWPISVFDLDRARAEEGGGAAELELRFGGDEESFVFNPAGQSIDIGGLVVVARVGGGAIGNPVKDSMATKIEERTRRVLAVVYTSRRLTDAEGVASAAGRFARLLERHASAERVWHGTLPS